MHQTYEAIHRRGHDLEVDEHDATRTRALRRITLRRAAAVIVLVVTGYGLWSHAHQLPSTLRLLGHPDPGWLLIIVATAVVTHIAAAACIHGATTVPLPRIRTFVVQVAASFTNRVAPAGLGGVVLNVRYLERQAVPRSRAVAAVGLSTAAGFVVHVALIAVVLLAAPIRPHTSLHVPHVVWLVAVPAALVAVAAALRRWPTRRVGEATRAIIADARAVLTSPSHALGLFGGSLGITLAHGVGLYAAVRAYGATPGPASTLAVYLIASAIGAVSPTPGGLGALEAALVAGLTTAAAVPPAAALSAVVTYRVLTYWLPIAPGAYAIHWLRHADLL